MTLRGVELIGVPTTSSGTVDGVARAPAVLRRGLVAALAGGAGLADAGDVRLPFPQPWRGPARVLAGDAPAAMIRPGCGAGRAARPRGPVPPPAGGDSPAL